MVSIKKYLNIWKIHKQLNYHGKKTAMVINRKSMITSRTENTAQMFTLCSDKGKYLRHEMSKSLWSIGYPAGAWENLAEEFFDRWRKSYVNFILCMTDK